MYFMNAFPSLLLSLEFVLINVKYEVQSHDIKNENVISRSMSIKLRQHVPYSPFHPNSSTRIVHFVPFVCHVPF